MEVPAGTFQNCIESVMCVSASQGEKAGAKNKDAGLLCETHSFYAPNVGLVREYQKTADGEVGYSMELESFNVEAPREHAARNYAETVAWLKENVRSSAAIEAIVKELDRVRKGGKSQTWNIGWGLTRNEKAYRVIWSQDCAKVAEISEEEARRERCGPSSVTSLILVDTTINTPGGQTHLPKNSLKVMTYK